MDYIFKDTYEQANKRSRRAELRSSLETENEEEVRAKKRPDRYLSESSDDDERPVGRKKKAPYTPFTPPTSLYTPTKLQTPPTLSSHIHANSQSPKKATSKCPVRLRMDSSCSLRSTPEASPVNIPRPSPTANNDALSRLLLKVNILEQNQQQMLSMLRSIVGAATPAKTVEVEAELNLDSPINSEAAMDECNSALEESPALKKKLIQHLITFGGKDLKTSTRKIMRFIGTNGVWSAYSLKGRKEKKALARLPLWQCILNALVKVQGATRADVEDCVAAFLKHTPFQLGGLLYKKTSSSSLTGQPQDEHHDAMQE